MGSAFCVTRGLAASVGVHIFYCTFAKCLLDSALKSTGTGAYDTSLYRAHLTLTSCQSLPLDNQRHHQEVTKLAPNDKIYRHPQTQPDPAEERKPDPAKKESQTQPRKESQTQREKKTRPSEKRKPGPAEERKPGLAKKEKDKHWTSVTMIY